MGNISIVLKILMVTKCCYYSHTDSTYFCKFKTIHQLFTIMRQSAWYSASLFPSLKVPVHASLFTLMNQEGQVVDFTVCPSDAMSHVLDILRKVWAEQKKAGVYSTDYFTDNIKKEKGNQFADILVSMCINPVAHLISTPLLFYTRRSCF